MDLFDETALFKSAQTQTLSSPRKVSCVMGDNTEVVCQMEEEDMVYAITMCHRYYVPLFFSTIVSVAAARRFSKVIEASLNDSYIRQFLLEADLTFDEHNSNPNPEFFEQILRKANRHINVLQSAPWITKLLQCDIPYMSTKQLSMCFQNGLFTLTTPEKFYKSLQQGYRCCELWTNETEEREWLEWWIITLSKCPPGILRPISVRVLHPKNADLFFQSSELLDIPSIAVLPQSNQPIMQIKVLNSQIASKITSQPALRIPLLERIIQIDICNSLRLWFHPANKLIQSDFLLNKIGKTKLSQIFINCFPTNEIDAINCVLSACSSNITEMKIFDALVLSEGEIGASLIHLWETDGVNVILSLLSSSLISIYERTRVIADLAREMNLIPCDLFNLFHFSSSSIQKQRPRPIGNDTSAENSFIDLLQLIDNLLLSKNNRKSLPKLNCNSKYSNYNSSSAASQESCFQSDFMIQETIPDENLKPAKEQFMLPGILELTGDLGAFASKFGWTKVLDFAANRPLVWLSMSSEGADVSSACGHVHVLDWWYEKSPFPFNYSERALEGASVNGHRCVLDWWLEKSESKELQLVFNSQVIHETCGSFSQPVLEWWTNKCHIPLIGRQLQHGIANACRRKDFEAVKWWLKSSNEPINPALLVVAESGDDILLELLFNHLNKLVVQISSTTWCDVAFTACANGHVNVLEKMKCHDGILECALEEAQNRSRSWIDAASSGGHMNILDWLFKTKIAPTFQNNNKNILSLKCKNKNINNDNNDNTSFINVNSDTPLFLKLGWTERSIDSVGGHECFQWWVNRSNGVVPVDFNSAASFFIRNETTSLKQDTIFGILKCEEENFDCNPPKTILQQKTCKKIGPLQLKYSSKSIDGAFLTKDEKLLTLWENSGLKIKLSDQLLRVACKDGWVWFMEWWRRILYRNRSSSSSIQRNEKFNEDLLSKTIPTQVSHWLLIEASTGNKLESLNWLKMRRDMLNLDYFNVSSDGLHATLRNGHVEVLKFWIKNAENELSWKISEIFHSYYSIKCLKVIIESGIEIPIYSQAGITCLIAEEEDMFILPWVINYLIKSKSFKDLNILSITCACNLQVASQLCDPRFNSIFSLYTVKIVITDGLLWNFLNSLGISSRSKNGHQSDNARINYDINYTDSNFNDHNIVNFTNNSNSNLSSYHTYRTNPTNGGSLIYDNNASTTNGDSSPIFTHSVMNNPLLYRQQVLNGEVLHNNSNSISKINGITFKSQLPTKWSFIGRYFSTCSISALSLKSHDVAWLANPAIVRITCRLTPLFIIEPNTSVARTANFVNSNPILNFRSGNESLLCLDALSWISNCIHQFPFPFLVRLLKNLSDNEIIQSDLNKLNCNNIFKEILKKSQFDILFQNHGSQVLKKSFILNTHDASVIDCIFWRRMVERTKPLDETNTTKSLICQKSCFSNNHHNHHCDDKVVAQLLAATNEYTCKLQEIDVSPETQSFFTLFTHLMHPESQL